MGNTFSRLIALCGLTQQEAADFLGIAKRTVAMKATDLRKPTDEEARRLAGLWSSIEEGALPADAPEGARRQALALTEAHRIDGGSGTREFGR